MAVHDFKFEEFFVSKAICFSFHGFDFVIQSFQGACRNRVIVMGQYAEAVDGNGFGHFLEHADAGPSGSPDPVGQKFSGGFFCPSASRPVEGLPSCSRRPQAAGLGLRLPLGVGLPAAPDSGFQDFSTEANGFP